MRDDIGGILTIYNDAILHTNAVYSYKPHSLAQQEKWFQEKQENNYPVLVDEESGQIAGFASFGSFRQWPAYQYTIENSIYTHKRFRKRGIATNLMQTLLKIADDKKYKTMVACIDSANAQSINLHEKFGFMKAGLIKCCGYKDGQWLDLLFMQLLLSGPTEKKSKDECF